MILGSDCFGFGYEISRFLGVYSDYGFHVWVSVLMGIGRISGLLKLEFIFNVLFANFQNSSSILGRKKIGGWFWLEFLLGSMEVGVIPCILRDWVKYLKIRLKA
jgi:hypothetical protein